MAQGNAIIFFYTYAYLVNALNFEPSESVLSKQVGYTNYWEPIMLFNSAKGTIAINISNPTATTAALTTITTTTTRFINYY